MPASLVASAAVAGLLAAALGAPGAAAAISGSLSVPGRAVTGRKVPVRSTDSLITPVAAGTVDSVAAPPMAFSAGRGVIGRPGHLHQWQLLNRNAVATVIEQRPLSDGELLWTEPEATSADGIFGSDVVRSQLAEGSLAWTAGPVTPVVDLTPATSTPVTLSDSTESMHLSGHFVARRVYDPVNPELPAALRIQRLPFTPRLAPRLLGSVAFLGVAADGDGALTTKGHRTVTGSVEIDS